MDTQHSKFRLRCLSSPVLLCVLGAVCSLPHRAQAQPSQTPAALRNDTDIEFSPQPGRVWSCTAGAPCTSSPDIYTEKDIAAWELKATDFPESCDQFDSDYDTAFADGFYAAACAWQTSCNNPDCEGKCIVNIYQDLNDQAAATTGQLDHNQDTIDRDTQLAWGLTCPMIAATIYRYADKGSGKGLPDLDAFKALPAPGMACPTDADIDAMATDINLAHKAFTSVTSPYNTNADEAIAPFSYAAANEANGELVMGFTGTPQEMKALVRERCTTAVVSDALMNLVVANGVWQYSFLLEDQGFSLSDLRGGDAGGLNMSETAEPDAGLTMCRDNKNLLEGLLKYAVAKPGQAANVISAVQDLPNGQCFGVRSASQLALDVPWLSFGDARSCEEESAVSLRSIHKECSKLTTKERCMQARFEDDQRLTVSYMNAMDSEVSTADFTDTCMVTFTNPWTGDVHQPLTTNEGAMLAAEDEETINEDYLADDGTFVATDDYADYIADDVEDDSVDTDAVNVDGDEDTTYGVVYGEYEEEVGNEIEEDDAAEVGFQDDEAGIGEADSSGIGQADASGVGQAVSEQRTNAASEAPGSVVIATVTVFVAMVFSM